MFCLDLGKACHTGYTYIASNSTISSDSSNKKNALEAKIGYWYDQTKRVQTRHGCMHSVLYGLLKKELQVKPD